MDERPPFEGYIANFGISLDVFEFLRRSRGALSPVCGIFDLTVELYSKVKNLIFKISLNQFDKRIFFLNIAGPYCFPLYVPEI